MTVQVGQRQTRATFEGLGSYVVGDIHAVLNPDNTQTFYVISNSGDPVPVDRDWYETFTDARAATRTSRYIYISGRDTQGDLIGGFFVSDGSTGHTVGEDDNLNNIVATATGLLYRRPQPETGIGEIGEPWTHVAYIEGNYANDEKLYRWIVDRNVTIDADSARNLAILDTATTAITNFVWRQNGADIVDIAFGVGATVGVCTASGAAEINLVKDDVVEIFVVGSSDLTAAGLTVSLDGHLPLGASGTFLIDNGPGTLGQLIDVDDTGASTGQVLTRNGGGTYDLQAPPKPSVEDDGVEQLSTADIFNFTGAGVTVTDAGGGQADIAISGGTDVWSQPALLGGNTAAANAALIQALIDGGDLLIHLPAGTFDCDPVNAVTGTYIRGEGVDRTILKHPTATITDVSDYGGVINVYGVDAANRISAVVLSDMTIDGNKANITVAGSTNVLNIECVDTKFAENCHYYRLRCINSVSDGLDYDESIDCSHTDCVAEDCDGYGSHFSTNCDGLTGVNFIARTCGAVHSRGGFDIFSSASDCHYVNPKTYTCYRGGYVQGNHSTITNHYDNASTNNSLRIAATHCVISGVWKDTAGTSNAITMESGADYNVLTGVVHNAGGQGLRVLSGADRNVIKIAAHFNGDDGIQVDGDKNNFAGSVSNNNNQNAVGALEYDDNGTGNIAPEILN